MIQDDDVMCDATAHGILECLRMLADEAASLRLALTVSVLEEAIRTCAREGAEAESAEVEALRRSANRALTEHGGGSDTARRLIH